MVCVHSNSLGQRQQSINCIFHGAWPLNKVLLVDPVAASEAYELSLQTQPFPARFRLLPAPWGSPSIPGVLIACTGVSVQATGTFMIRMITLLEDP